MKAGRELDILVAEKVLGLKVVKTVWGKRKQYGCYSIGEPDWYDDAGATELGNPLPAYSTDIAAAWEVVEHMNNLGTKSRDAYFILNKSDSGFKVSFYRRKHVGPGQWDYVAYHGTVKADTAPMAICLAALKAVEK